MAEEKNKFDYRRHQTTNNQNNRKRKIDQEMLNRGFAQPMNDSNLNKQKNKKNEHDKLYMHVSGKILLKEYRKKSHWAKKIFFTWMI